MDAIALAASSDYSAVDWLAVESGPVIVHPLRVKRPDLPASMFADNAWSLQPMGIPRGTVQTLHWVSGPIPQRYQIPLHLVGPFKRIVWLLINRPAPASYLAGGTARTWISAASIQDRFRALRRFAYFLGQQDVTELCEVDGDLLDAYVAALVADGSRAVEHDLGPIAVIPHLAVDLPEADRMVEPSWSAGELLKGDDARGADNSKAIIDPDTFAPLLWWAQQIVRCAPDIIAARMWLNEALSRPGPRESSREGLDAVGRLVASRRGVLPQGNDGYVAAQYLVALDGGHISRKDFSIWRRVRGGSYTLDPNLGQPIPLPVTCTIEGRPWLPSIDFRDVREGKLERVLQAAAAVLICSCTGMRGEECRKLQRGVLRTVPRPDGAHSYRIEGRIFKAVVDETDQQDRDGKRWVWATIRPGADAISALEQLAGVTNSLSLFAHPDRRRPDRRATDADHSDPFPLDVTNAAIARWIVEFIQFANELRTTLGLHHVHHIATDPSGNVTLDRFRRSVAWHIVNQPEGLVAAGVQFGHMKSTTTDGYGSTMTSGIAATMDKERTHALYNTLQDHANAAKTGLKVSGPAAKRLGNALNRFTVNQFPGTYADLSKKEERRLRSDPDMAVRDNPGHACLCLADPMKPETMACTRENDGEPNRNDCKTYCGSRVYTDATIAQDKKEAAQLRDRLQNVNPILAARIARRITHLEEHIAQHENTALPLLTIMSAEEAKAARVVEKDQPLSSKPPNVPTDGDVA
ncbi:hypothetical protein OS121_26745 [Mycolicibacterium mucogenicum]|uniref:hypothetical protein n=1 Tax=Mycolicibacterium mucogenicum TaxID=56689 RepID=UPI002269A705|nr:hypothetical protein [Mycolicibacterium mucogenicum]MCX8558651.1 hypothetical protein [Mycolicibacterium mucogenicum]